MGGMTMDMMGNEGGLYKPKTKTGAEAAMDFNAGIEDTYNYGGMTTDEIMGDGVKPDLKLDSQSAGGFDLGGLFKADKIGGTLSGIGEIAKAGAMVYDAYNKKKYQDKVFGMEEKRVARETARQDKQQANYDKVFG
jgi:hypothetical protein